MKGRPGLLASAASAILTLVLAGCGHKDGGGHDHGHDHSHDDGHEPGEKTPLGVSFKAGHGVRLPDETRKILGVEIADVTQRKLPNQIRFTVQVFGEKHHHLLNQEDHSGCDTHGSGFVPTNMATAIRIGQPVQVLQDTNTPLGGVVLAVQKALALDESEVVIGISNATAALRAGEFVPVRLRLPRAEAVAAIPQSAVLRTSEGSFVYAVNGDAYFRKAVKVGAEADGWAEITDGLRAGHQVVTRPVQTLWLIELRATKGGGHSH